MFEEIKIAFFKNKDAKGPYWPADFLEALNRGNRIVENCFSGRGKWGRIAAGYKADIAMLDLDAPYLRPVHNQLNNLVYAACGSDVVMTMVDGRVLYDHGSFPHLDIEKLLYETEHSCQRILRELQSVQS